MIREKVISLVKKMVGDIGPAEKEKLERITDEDIIAIAANKLSKDMMDIWYANQKRR